MSVCVYALKWYLSSLAYIINTIETEDLLAF